MVARNFPPASAPVQSAPVPRNRPVGPAASSVASVAPAPVVEPKPEPPQLMARVEEKPAEPELAPPLAKQSKVESVGVVGGVPGGTVGGVIGGIIGAAPGFRNSLQASAERADRPAATGLPFKYTLQRRDADGVFRESPAGSTFAPGEAVIVSVEPLASGMLRVYEGTQQIYARRVEAGQRYAIPESGAFEIGPDGKDRVLLVQIDMLRFPITIPAKK